MQARYVFGPVESSRLGRSLGLDLLGRKICTFDCLYCEVGPTKAHTAKRAAHVPASTILDELAQWRKAHVTPPDFVTLGGSGEPCLNSDMGAVLAGARELFPHTDLAVLTNTSLFHVDEVREQLLAANAVLPSLDSLVPAEYALLNRPAPDLAAGTEDQGLTRMAEALLDFRREFSGRMFLEVLLVAGVNDSEENLELLAEYVNRLGPDRVDVVTMTRPGAHQGARPVDPALLERWRGALGAAIPGGPSPRTHPKDPEAAAFRQAGAKEDAGLAEDIEEMLYQSVRRRPQTAGQLARALDVPLAKVQKTLASLVKHGHILNEEEQGPEGVRTFYRGVRP